MIAKVIPGNVLDRSGDSYFESIIKNQTFYIVKTDLNGNYTYLSPYFCQILGVKEQDWIGKNSLGLVIPADHALCLEAVQKCFNDPDKIQRVILRKESIHGLLSTQWEFVMLRNEDQELVEILCIGHDITPLIKKQENLQHLVDITAQQNKRLLDFTYIVSHNVRSHVANLSGILNNIDVDDQADLSYSLDLLKICVDGLDDTIFHLNEIIKIQAETNLPVSFLNVKNEILKISKVLKTPITKSKASILSSVADDDTIYTNPAYLESILLNLISNSIKYCSKDHKPIIDISLTIEDNYKVLTVKDNGLGIDLIRNDNKIFKMFNTFHGNKDAKGMGLFIIKNQIEAMKGKIEVESQVGLGTTFKVYFVNNE